MSTSTTNDMQYLRDAQMATYQMASLAFQPPPYQFGYANNMPMHQSQSAASFAQVPLMPFMHASDWGMSAHGTVLPNFAAGCMPNFHLRTDQQTGMPQFACANVQRPKPVSCTAYPNTIGTANGIPNSTLSSVSSMNRNSSEPSLNSANVTQKENRVSAVATDSGNANVQATAVRTRNSNAHPRSSNASTNTNLKPGTNNSQNGASGNATGGLSHVDSGAVANDGSSRSTQSRPLATQTLPAPCSAAQAQPMSAAHSTRSHPPSASTLPPRFAAMAAKQAAERSRQCQSQTLNSCTSTSASATDCSTSSSCTREEAAPKYSILKRDSNAKRDEQKVERGEPVSYEKRLREYEAARRRILGCPTSGCNCNGSGTCNASTGARRSRNTNAAHEKRPDCFVVSRRCAELPPEQKAKDTSETDAATFVPAETSNADSPKSIDQSASVDPSCSPKRSRSTSPHRPQSHSANSDTREQPQPGAECQRQIDGDVDECSTTSDVKQAGESRGLGEDCKASETGCESPGAEADTTEAQSQCPGAGSDGDDVALARSACSNGPKITILKRERR